MQVLLDVSRALGSSALYEDALAIVARKAGEALGLSSSVINEYVPELDSLVIRANYDRDEGESYDGLGVATHLDEASGDRAILEGGEIVVEQVSDPELPADTRGSMEQWGEKTCLNVPLWFKGQPIGMMMLLESAEERHFSEGELDLARAIGEQAAMAIQNARLYRSLKQKSETDKLTGLHNSRYFRQRVTDEVARARRHHLPVALFIADVDDLRRFTVAAGRQLANELLTTVADLIRARVHARVDVAAHLGGGKFAVLLPHTPLEGDEGVAEASPAGLDGGRDGPHRQGALGVAERLRREVEALTILAAGTRLPQAVTTSIGVVEFSIDMANAEAFMDAAEDAVGRAKKAGKNRVEAAG
jgi:GGDEF domain-containing protein